MALSSALLVVAGPTFGLYAASSFCSATVRNVCVSEADPPVEEGPALGSSLGVRQVLPAHFFLLNLATRSRLVLAFMARLHQP